MKLNVLREGSSDLSREGSYLLRFKKGPKLQATIEGVGARCCQPTLKERKRHKL